MSVVVREVSKWFGAFRALDRVSLEVGRGELVALLGPSGSGKTTLLRVIAGLEAPDAGQIVIEGKDTTRQPARERGIGFVFQHYALFRHLTVFENVAFGLRVRPRGQRPSEPALRRRVAELLATVQLDGLADRYPAQLSGGQRQRVALARALAIEPRVLLLDEPFGALDAGVRRELRQWVRELLHELHLTALLVTHDQEEALEIADRLAILRAGRIEQVGAPREIYDQPANAFVCEFLGQTYRWPGAGTPTAAAEETPVAYVRPHELHLSREPAAGALAAEVRAVRLVGPQVRVQLALATPAAPLVEAHLTREQYAALALAAGERVYARPLRLYRFATNGVTRGPWR
jgi:sulfate transport system ATP-binding protein